MGTITHGGTLPDSSQKTDFYSIIDNATVTGIVNADCASTMALVDTKLASITTAGKVDGSAMNNLGNIPSGAGVIPVINLSSIYPVGTIYMNDAVSTNPATLFGFGTWVAITDRIIIGVGSTYTPAGATGGASTVTIAKANVPSLDVVLPSYGGGINAGGSWNITGNTGNGSTGNQTFIGASGGSGTALNVMNPYYAAYVWRRTA